MNMLKQIFALMILLSCAVVSIAQVPMQEVTKSIQKSIPFELGSEVKIDGEKADVYLSTWDKNRVAVYLDIIATHPDKAQAEADLKAVEYSLEKKGLTIVISNSIDTESKAIQSKIQAKYTIILPERCPVDLANIFGTAEIRGLSNALVVNASYCDLQLTNLNGFINIETVFGDVKGRTISGKVNFKSSFTDIDLAEVQGDWKMNVSQGILKIDAAQSAANFDIVSDQTEVYFLNPPVGFFNFEILAGLTQLELPDEPAFHMKNIAQDLKQVTLSSPAAQGSFKIKATHGKVVVPLFVN